MNSLLLFIACWLAISLFLRAGPREALGLLSRTARKLAWLITTSKISDAKKERMIPFYALIIAGKSLKIFVVISAIALLLFTPMVFSKTYLSHLFSFQGVVSSIVFSAVILKLKKISSNE